jgi:3,4-dihydroxy 2-butanone 4-phosphate synthase/GTP cyclohydrolase II
MGPADFVRPGHVFPLIAREGGVLMRSGHTEAAVDLCRLASLPPVGVICELANDDGTVMAGPQIEAFAAKHGLKRISVADLIAHRQAREKIVERVNTFQVMGTSGPLTGYAYVTPYDPVRHFAFVQGDIGDGRDIPTRLHRIDIIADVIAGGDSIRKTFAARKTAAGYLFFCATARPASRSTQLGWRNPIPKPSASWNGAKSVSAPRSCAISGSPRSACAPVGR